MRKLFLASVGAIILTGSSYAQQHQPNSYADRNVSLGAFDQIEISGPFKVFVYVSDKPARASLSGPPALLADTIVEIAGDTLKVRFREGASWSWNPGSGVHVAVLASKLNAVRVQGAADVEVAQVRGKTFSAATSGSGSIALRGLEAEQVNFATGGAGGITAEGIANAGSYAAAGSGSIDAKRLRVRTASVSIGGSGSIYADVAKTANISVDGSGSVDVVGGATCSLSPAHSRQIECR